MVIFQMVSGDATSLGLSKRILADATTFQSNEYIHRLNRTLQWEVRALSAYDSWRSEAEFREIAASHQYASRELVKLVIASRGVPEDRAAVHLGLTKSFIQLCHMVPMGLGEKVAYRTLGQLERHLTGSYAGLLNLAPSRDKPVLAELLEQTERQATTLASFR